MGIVFVLQYSFYLACKAATFMQDMENVISEMKITFISLSQNGYGLEYVHLHSLC